MQFFYDIFRCRTHATGETPAFASGHDASGTPRKRTRHTAHPHHREAGQGTVNIHRHTNSCKSFCVLFCFVFVFSSYWARVLAVDRDDSSSPEKIVPLGSGFFFFCFSFCVFHITTTSNKIGRLDGSLRQRQLTKFQKNMRLFSRFLD